MRSRVAQFDSCGELRVDAIKAYNARVNDSKSKMDASNT